jgi:hypothetical protein
MIAVRIAQVNILSFEHMAFAWADCQGLHVCKHVFKLGISSQLHFQQMGKLQTAHKHQACISWTEGNAWMKQIANHENRQLAEHTPRLYRSDRYVEA